MSFAPESSHSLPGKLSLLEANFSPVEACVLVIYLNLCWVMFEKAPILCQSLP